MNRPRALIGLRDLVLFNIAAVTSLRWIAAAAHAGPVSLLLWVLAAVLFFLPSAIAVGALARRYPLEGGLYVWARESFGEWHGFLCGYCYVVSNLFYFASLSMAIASAAALLLGVAAGDGVILAAALGLVWAATAVAILGGRVMRWTGNLAASGICVTGAALLLLFGSGGRVEAAATAWDWSTLNLWSQLALAFAGLELGAVLAGEIRDPRRTIPAAAAISGAIIAGVYVLGTAAILSALPPQQVSPVTGLIDALRIGGERWGGPALGLALGMVAIFGMAGQLGAWINGNSRLPFVLGMDRFLPPAFSKLHPGRGTPWVALVVQAGAASVLALLFAAGETTRAGYQLLVDMTVLLAFLPFLYIFGAALRLGHHRVAAAGLSVTLLAMLLSFVPPPGVVSVFLFEMKVAGGCVLLVVLSRLYYRRVAVNRRRIDPRGESHSQEV